MHREITACRICGNPTLHGILDLGRQCLTGVFPRNAEEEVPQAPLELVKCAESPASDACGLVQLRHSCDHTAMYGHNYGYRSSLNAAMVEHLSARVATILGQAPLRTGDLVVDIGSNDATLLRQYPASLGLALVGIDPSGAKLRHFYPKHIQLIPEFFSAGLLPGRRARVVTSIAMFYDLESPGEFMRQVRGLLTDDGIWVFEQSYLRSMLAQRSYDTICHEHLEYYSLKQIKWLTDRNDLKILDVEFNGANGGSFAVTVAPLCAPYRENHRLVEQILLEEERGHLRRMEPYAEFARSVITHRGELRSFLDRCRDRRLRLGGYGASTKGNVVLQFCGITSDEIPWIADVNEEKWGHFTPGTHIPIVSETQGRAARPSHLLVFPWHFRSYTISRESEYLASGGTLVFLLPRVEEVRRSVPANLTEVLVSAGGQR